MAFQTQELSPEKYPLSQLVLKLSRLTLTPTNTNQLQISTASQLPIRVNQIIKHIKNSYLDHWDKETQSQNKLNCYRALNREYTEAEYLFSVRDTKQRRILTKYRLSDHTLAIERGRYKKSWLAKEEGICGPCKTGEVETPPSSLRAQNI